MATLPDRSTVTMLALVAFAIGATTSSAAQQPAGAGSIASATPAGVAVPADYVIGAEDVLGVLFWREPDMSGEVIVRPDGKITLPLIGELVVAGLKPETVRGEVQKAAGRFFSDANVNIVVKQINSRKVFITGQVGKPGAYPLMAPHSVLQLIALAGGISEYADGDNITIMRPDQKRTRVFKFNYKKVSRGNELEQNIQLMPGDTVVVP
jgi:polysaccharide export outer membrane protein